METRPYYVDPKHITDQPRSGYVQITRKRGRSVQHNRKYWAMLAEVIASGATLFPTVEHLHDALKLECGFVTYAYRLDGSVLVVPDSTAFHKMGQDEFNAFFERAIDLIQTHLIPGFQFTERQAA